MKKRLGYADENGKIIPLSALADDALRLECLKLVMPAGGNPDPQHYIPRAEVLLTWIKSGGDTGNAAPTPQPIKGSDKSGTP